MLIATVLVVVLFVALAITPAGVRAGLWSASRWPRDSVSLRYEAPTGFQPGSDGGIISTGPSRGPRALCRYSVGCRARIHEGLGPFLPEGEQMAARLEQVTG